MRCLPSLLRASLLLVLAGNALVTDLHAAEVEVQGVLVHAGLATDPGLEHAVQGSVSFLVNVPLEKIAEQLKDPNTLSKFSNNIENMKVTKVSEDDKTAVYKVQEDLVPTSGLFGVGKLAKTNVHLIVTIDTSLAKDNEAFSMKWDLDPAQPKSWDRLSGHLRGINLGDGSSLLILVTSSKSQYKISDGVRMKLVQRYLADTKNNLVKWLKSLPKSGK